MTHEDWHRVTDLFHAALARDPEGRDAFLDEECRGDRDLRGRVDRLLAAHRDAGSFGEIASSVTTSSNDESSSRDPRQPPPVPARTRWRHPFTWLIGFAALTIAILFAQAVAVLIETRGASAAFGWSEARRAGAWSVSAVDPSGPAAGRLLPGDRLIAFDGGRPVRAGTIPYRLNVVPGDTYRLTIERDGQRLDLMLPVEAGPSLLARRLDALFVGLVWCIVGLLIGLARPWRSAPRLASGAAVLTGIGFVTAKLLRQGPFFHPLHAVLGYHFFSRFPGERGTTGAWRGSLPVLYALGGLAVLLSLWSRWTLLTGGPEGYGRFASTHPFLFRMRQPLATGVFCLSLVLTVIIVARNYRRLVQEDQRRRVRWVVLGSVIALVPQLLQNTAGALLGTSKVAWMGLPASALTVALPVSVAYAVVRHQLFDIRVAVRRGARYLLARRVLQAAVAIPIVALIFNLVGHRDLTIAHFLADTRGWLFWLGTAGLALRYRKPLRSWLDRRFFREAYDRERLLSGLLDDMRKVESTTELARVVSDALSATLHPETVCVWYRDPDELASATTADPVLTPPDIPSGERWLRWVEDQGRPTGVPPPIDAGLSRGEARWLTDRRIRLIVPMMDSGDRLVGTLLLGEKKADEPYSRGETQLLDTVAKQAAVVRDNLRLRARVGEDARVRHAVLARLDGRALDLLKECPRCGACFDGEVDRCPTDGLELTLPLPVTRTLEGKYRLDRLIGRGGMGTVYEAHDVRLDRTVAVKILRGSAFGRPSALRRFDREARAAARVNHPNIVALFDYGLLDGGGAYLVMERLRGVTMRHELESAGPMPPRTVAAWFEPLLDGVAAAHDAGIIHRDLKPENVIGQPDGAEPAIVKILDLGLARFREFERRSAATVTAEGTVIGTPSYMSPEQLAGNAVDERTDIYAIGVMLTEALTGRRPLPGGRFHAASSRAVQPGAGTADGPHVRAIRDLVQRCLARDPRERFRSARILREQLIPLLRAWASPDRIADAASRLGLPVDRLDDSPSSRE